MNIAILKDCKFLNPTREYRMFKRKVYKKQYNYKHCDENLYQSISLFSKT